MTDPVETWREGARRRIDWNRRKLEALLATADALPADAPRLAWVDLIMSIKRHLEDLARQVERCPEGLTPEVRRVQAAAAARLPVQSERS